MELLTLNESDYCVTKVVITAALLDAKLTVKAVDEDALLKLAPEGVPKSMALQTKDGNLLTQHMTILRYLAESVTAAKLGGGDETSIAKVDQWLSFSWQELGGRLFLQSTCSILYYLLSAPSAVLSSTL